MSEETSAPQNPQIEFLTSRGRIVIELYPAKAPASVENFLQYVDSGFYAGTIFHRIIDNFVVQGGGFDDKMNQKEVKAPIQNEADNGLKNIKGSISMARTSDPHSATSQFFLSLADNGFLDHTGKNPQGWGYAVFGQIIEGIDVLDQLGKVTTGRTGMHSDVPKEAIIVTAANRLQAEDEATTEAETKE